VLQMLKPLTNMRVWRFGLYYFLVFGGFVALAQWLVPYYVNVYSMTIVTAGLMTSIFSLPSGVIRALGGWFSDVLGARQVLYWVLAVIGLCSFLLIFPKMDIESPGRGVMAQVPGTVTAVTEDQILVSDRSYALIPPPEGAGAAGQEFQPWPVSQTWHVPAVTEGESVARRQLLARGVTHIYFQANVWIFTVLVFAIGIAMGIGKAAVYRYIPDYFPDDVGVVGGLVGVLGGLGGFVCPIIFGTLLDGLGLWTTTWIFLFFITVVCLVWLSLVVRKMSRHI
jgi:NNP family nitrate/nitrite transporter-like MFS transporter